MIRNGKRYGESSNVCVTRRTFLAGSAAIGFPAFGGCLATSDEGDEDDDYQKPDEDENESNPDDAEAPDEDGDEENESNEDDDYQKPDEDENESNSGDNEQAENQDGTVNADPDEYQTVEAVEQRPDCVNVLEFGDLAIVEYSERRENRRFGNDQIYVEGIVENRDAEMYDFVSVRVRAFDVDVNQLDRYLDTTQDLQGGGTWKFEVPILEDADEVDVWDIAVTGTQR